MVFFKAYFWDCIGTMMFTNDIVICSESGEQREWRWMSLNTYDQPSKATERTQERWRRECKQGKWVEISLRDLRRKSNFITQNKILRYKLTSNNDKVSHVDPKSPTGGHFLPPNEKDSPPFPAALHFPSCSTVWSGIRGNGTGSGAQLLKNVLQQTEEVVLMLLFVTSL